MSTRQRRRLTLSSVTAGYGDHEVLSGISLEVETGSVTALLGTNGVGKTTLLNVALGWKQPESGTVELDGRRLGDLGRGERGRAIALVPQAEHIAFEYTILEYVLLGRSPHTGPTRGPGAGDLAAARSALEAVGLEGMESRGVLDTSAGERQLVLLARAIAQDPAFVLMDEPSAHLDLRNKRALVDLVRARAQAGCGVLLTVHEPELAAFAAERIVLLHEGRILAEGAAHEVLTSELLSTAYRTDVVAKEVDGRLVVLW